MYLPHVVSRKLNSNTYKILLFVKVLFNLFHGNNKFPNVCNTNISNGYKKYERNQSIKTA